MHPPSGPHTRHIRPIGKDGDAPVEDHDFQLMDILTLYPQLSTFRSMHRRGDQR